MPPATPAQLVMLFSTLIGTATVLTSLIAILSFFASIWLLVFCLSFMLVWMTLDCITIYADLKLKDSPTLQFKINEQLHLDTICDMAVQAERLKKANSKLTKTIEDYQITTLANLHWNLLYNKAMSMYYVQKIIEIGKQTRKKTKERDFKSKGRLFMQTKCFSLTDIYTGPGHDDSSEEKFSYSCSS